MGESRNGIAHPAGSIKLRGVESFDYIIVGAGTAGCVLADRLSASGRNRVLVLEAGGSDARFWIKAPIGYGFTFADERVNWKYQAQGSPGLNGRGMYWPRGRVVGGSSSINALVYCRGMPGDFDDWRDLGNPGWGWEEVRPYFERLERRVAPDGRARTEGPVDVKDVTPYLHPMRKEWLEAAAELKLPVTADFNGPNPEGLGCYQLNVRNGRRWSAADAFLRPALKRPNVKLETGAWASKLRCEGRRVSGVEFFRDNEPCFARADREVILCAGAVNSPQLLQLSGIGPGRLLSEHGIETVLDNSAVGGHLQDHLAVVYSFKAARPTLNDELHSPARQLLAGMRYLLTRRGPVSLSVNQFGGFLRADPRARRPDVQLYFNPVTYGAGDAARSRITVDAFSGFYLCFQPTRPTSTGRIDLGECRLPHRPVHRTELSVHREGRERRPAWGAAAAGHCPHARDPQPHPRAARARPAPHERARSHCRLSRTRRDRLSPGRHVPDGTTPEGQRAGPSPRASWSTPRFGCTGWSACASWMPRSFPRSHRRTPMRPP